MSRIAPVVLISFLGKAWFGKHRSRQLDAPFFQYLDCGNGLGQKITPVTRGDKSMAQGLGFVIGVAVLLGNTSVGMGQTLLFTLHGPPGQVGREFGLALAGVGDVDGDGVPDLAVGAPEQGRVFLFSGATGQRLRTLNNPTPQAGARFGRALAGVGDVDGDGVPDLTVGAPGQDVEGRDTQGQVFLFSGATGQQLRTLNNPTPQAGARFGRELAGVGDVDGDGVSDLAVGAPFQPVEGRRDRGRYFSSRAPRASGCAPSTTPRRKRGRGLAMPWRGWGMWTGTGSPTSPWGRWSRTWGAVTRRGKYFSSRAPRASGYAPSTTPRRRPGRGLAERWRGWGMWMGTGCPT